jgi:streptomycin 6-kinase
MTDLAMPRALVSAAAIPDEWISALPDVIRRLEDRWSLRLSDPYQPGGVTSWVAPAVDDDGRDVVLKVTHPGVETLHESDGLRVWDGDGAVRLLDVITDEQYTALLLERCVPGTTLGATASSEQQDEVLAALLCRLWQHSPGDADLLGFRPLQDMCDYWAAEFDAKLAAQPQHIDAGLARAGIELFRELPASAPSTALLVTDLHAGNIVSAQREPWLMIDPKPYVGDPHYDPLQHLLNDPSRLQRDPLGRSVQMAGLLDLDAERLRLWLFARCVQECFTWPYLREVARAIAP